MSDTFSAKRFVLLLKKTIAERPMQTIGVMVLWLLMSLILYVAAKKLSGFGAAQNLTFIWGLAGGEFFISSFMFGYFSTNANGSSYLTLPVSFLEKWLCAILIAGILYPIIFLLFFHGIDTAFVAAYHNSLDKTSVFYQQQYESVYTFSLNGMVAQKVYSLFLAFGGAMLTGSLYFNKIALIKTGISLTLLFLIIFGVNWLMASTLFQNINDAGPYDHVTLAVGKETGTLILPTNLEHNFHTGIDFVMPVVLWFLPLLRLREKEF